MCLALGRAYTAVMILVVMVLCSLGTSMDSLAEAELCSSLLQSKMRTPLQVQNVSAQGHTAIQSDDSDTAQNLAHGIEDTQDSRIRMRDTQSISQMPFYSKPFVSTSLLSIKEVVREAFPVDIVIACSLPSDAGLNSEAIKEGHSQNRDRDNGELKYTLRSIAQHAPWVNRIFLLMNGQPQMPDWVPDPHKTQIVNRCELLPVDPSLPKSQCTRNGAVVQTIVHKVPGLSEHFLYTDDDNLLGRDARVSDFFKDGVPYFGNSKNPELDVAVYATPKNTGLHDDQIPKTITRWPSMPHTWVALTKKACQEMEAAFPQWFAFVRSHRRGRYSSKLNETATTASEQGNSVEDFLSMGTWWWWLRTKHEGEYSQSSKFDDTRIGWYQEGAWEAVSRHPPFILNVNDDMAVDDEQKYLRQHELMVRTLDRMFPDPHVVKA